MRVTPTDREVVTLFPGLRLMAMSMSRLEVARTGILPIPAEVIRLHLVLMLEEPPTMGTAPALPVEPGGQAGTDRRVPSPSRAPVHPIPVVRTPMARDLRGPPTGDLAVGGQIRLALTGGRRGQHSTGVPSRPVSVLHPSGRGVGVSPACPVAALHPDEMVHPAKGGLTHPRAIVMGPAPDDGVELADQGRLRPGPTGPKEPTECRQMRLDVGLGWCDQGVEPERLMASGSLAGLVCAHPIVAEVATSKVHAGRLAFQGVAEAGFGEVQGQSDRRQPGPQAWLAVVQDGAIRVEHQTIIGVSDDAGLRIDLGDGRVQPMQSDQRSEGRHPAALWRACGGGSARVRLHDP
jgi:hypothetical protein